MAVWAAGSRVRTPKCPRPSGSRAPSPQTPAPSAGAGARAVFLGRCWGSPASPLSSPCLLKNLRCRFSPMNLQLHKSALPIPPCWHGYRCPNVRTNSLFCQALDYPVCPDPPSADSVDFADFVGAVDSNTAPCVQTSIVLSALPLTILTRSRAAATTKTPAVATRILSSSEDTAPSSTF